MKTLFEDLIRIPDLDAAIRASLEEAQRIRVNNVVSFMIEDEKNFRENTKKLPVVIPPFPVTWIEFEHDIALGKKDTYGYLLIRDKKTEMKHLMVPDWVLSDEDTFYVIYVMVFSRSSTQGKEKQIHLENNKAIKSLIFPLQQDGSMIDGKNRLAISYAREYLNSIKEKGVYDKVLRTDIGIFDVVLFSLGLLHCKNVVLENVNPPAIIKQRNRHQRPAVPYHVLKIRPMSTRTTGGGEWRGGGSPSIHIRRGHFKDYRYGAGLFGKYNDIFWWESDVVGKKGVLSKTIYDITPKK